jgi:hypothetical protein
VSTNQESVIVHAEGFDPGATPGTDIDLLDREVTFAPGESGKAVLISALNDDEWEGAERFGLTLTDPKSGERVGPNTPVELTVYESVGQLSGEPQGDEFGGLTFTLKRTSGLQHSVTVTYRTRPDADTANSAVAGVDYLAAEGTISFAPGEETKTIRIATIDNQRLEASARWFWLEFDSKSPYLIGNSFRLWIPDDEPLSVRPVAPWPSRVTEGGVIRLQLTRSGELAGDTRIGLRHRIALRPCDGSSWGDWPLGPDGLPSGWQLVSEGTTTGLGPRDRTLWLELMAPDDTELQATNRCLTVILDSPDRPDALARSAGDLDGLAVNLELEDNESSIVTDSTGVIPGAKEDGSFIPLSDGSAYFLGEVVNQDGQGYPVLSRIRPELDRDPQFEPEIPTELVPTAIAPMPAGGVLVAGVNWRDQRWTLLSLDQRGRAKAAFLLETPLRGVSVMKTTSDGFIYLSDGRRLMRLKPDGKPDPAFEEPEIHGTIERIWLDRSTAYLGGQFTNFAGLPRTNLGLIHIQGNGSPDPEFVGLVKGAQWSIRELVPLESGRLLTIESDMSNANMSQIRRTDGGVLLEHQGGQFEHLAQLGNGRVFRASGSYRCIMMSCFGERSLWELRLDASAEGDWVDVLPTLRWRGTSLLGPRQRIYAAGEYLWIQESSSNTYRRQRFLEEGETAFGLVPGTESGLRSQGGRLVAAVRRYATASDHAATATVRVRMGRSDSRSHFEPFEVPVTFAVGEVTKPILLPEGFHFTPDSLSEIRVKLIPPAGAVLGGATEMSSLMVGVPEQPAAYRLAIHRLGQTIADEQPLLTVTGPYGRFRVDACSSLDAANSPEAWSSVLREFVFGGFDDAPGYRLSPDTPTAVHSVPGDLNQRLGGEDAFFRVVADE